MASDEESTQPVDVGALRPSRPSRAGGGGAPASHDEPDPDAATAELNALVQDPSELERTGELPSQLELGDSDILEESDLNVTSEYVPRAEASEDVVLEDIDDDDETSERPHLQRETAAQGPRQTATHGPRQTATHGPRQTATHGPRQTAARPTRREPDRDPAGVPTDSMSTGRPETQRPSAAPASTAFQPPVVRAFVPACELDTDDEENQLRKNGAFRALADLYRERADDAEVSTDRASLLHKLASVHEHRLGESDRAFEALLEAFALNPRADDIVGSLDRVARATGRTAELAGRTLEKLSTCELDVQVVLLGHVVYWYERVLGRASELAPFVAELERLDKAHPLIQRRDAQVAAANGDVKTQRELLLRALERTGRPDERARIHLDLAHTQPATAEALRHFEAAVSHEPTSIVALQGLERMGREQAKHAQVEWSLERQVEVAASNEERVNALFKLAALFETKYLKRERAAEILELAIELDPHHALALKALERCYHALRDWARLTKVLGARATSTLDPKGKIEILELVAEVFESKLGDVESAVAVQRQIVAIDPKHRRALGDLARLHEKLGAWADMGTYKARLAELAPSKRQASQQLVQLGDSLAAPERDEAAALRQYDRAVAVDPTNAGAWEALQRVAAKAGDDARVAMCLDQRAKNVDGPRQRAAIYVELAHLHARCGNDRAARDAFERAIAADGTNESAAIAMLEVYVREEAWDEAAPLCDLLVNAAVRDSDSSSLFTRLRLATRIGAAHGDDDGAMMSALAALDIDPDHDGAQTDLIEVCMRCRDDGNVVARAKEWLTRIARGSTVLPVAVRVALAKLQRDAGEVDAAIETLERARREHTKGAERADVLSELADLLLAQGDHQRSCELKLELARGATTPELRFRLLCEAGEIWALQTHELDKAAKVYEEAWKIKPLDHALLHTLMWLYAEQQRWDDLSKVLEAIAHIQESPERKAKSLFAMAQVVLKKVGDPRAAAALFDQVLDSDVTRLDAFEQLVRALTEVKDWEALAAFYEKMLLRIESSSEARDGALQFALCHQLGLIYRDRLDDAQRAYGALELAARLRPDDTNIRKIVTELLVVTDNLDEAVVRIRAMIARTPHEPDLYAELYELFLRQHYFDKAWCAVNVLVQLRELSPAQRRFHEDYAPVPLSQVPGQIVEDAWRSHILHPDLDLMLTALLAGMIPLVARVRQSQLRLDPVAQAMVRPFTPAHSALYEPVRMTFANAAEILHMVPPDLLLGDPASLVPFAPSIAPFGAVNVSVAAVALREESLIYVIGKRLAEQRPELIARAFFPAVSDLASLFGTAVRIGRQERAKDATAAALDASLEAVVTPPEREAIRAIVAQATMVGGVVDVKRWLQAADLSSMRAGLLLCGDVGPARRVILADPQSTADLPPREKIAELYRFATSDVYAELRGAIGVAVQA